MSNEKQSKWQCDVAGNIDYDIDVYVLRALCNPSYNFGRIKATQFVCDAVIRIIYSSHLILEMIFHWSMRFCAIPSYLFRFTSHYFLIVFNETKGALN